MPNTELPPELKVGTAEPSDHSRIIHVMIDWWGGRDLTHMLPRLFIEHFHNTSFVVEHDGELVAFLVGFLSPAHPEQGYIHFAGVHPDYRGKGIGAHLYHRFFEICRDNGRRMVRSCTSPVNKGSIAFHLKMGFRILEGGVEVNGIPVTFDYNRPDDNKVLFEFELR